MVRVLTLTTVTELKTYTRSERLSGVEESRMKILGVSIGREPPTKGIKEDRNGHVIV